MKTYLTVFIISIFLIPFLLSLFIKEIPNDVQPSLEATQIIYKDINARQAFKSEMDNLSGIGTSIKNPYFRNKKNLQMEISTEDNQTVRTINVNGANIPDGDFSIFMFEPIKESKNKRYFLSVSAPEAVNSDALEMFLTSQQPSWLEDFYVNSEKKDFKLSIVTYHKPANLFTIATGVLSQMLKRLVADLPFALFYFVVIGGLTGYLIKTGGKS